MSIVVGFLQYLVPATPCNIGASLLQPIYQDLHRPQTNGSSGTKKFYLRTVLLSQASQLCLKWWSDDLKIGMSKQMQPRDVATLGISWGDGTGTGGTAKKIPRLNSCQIACLKFGWVYRRHEYLHAHPIVKICTRS